MADDSRLDRKYFIDEHIYNCPFCKRRHVTYSIILWYQFNWTEKKNCLVYFVKCTSCEKVSMHLSYEIFLATDYRGNYIKQFRPGIDIDARIFHSIPTSFFVLDSRIPEKLRELIAEAEGCLKMNFLTGASACARKAIYELTVRENAEGGDYESKIKFLKGKYPSVDATLFDVLSHIQDMTSDKVHEQSWPKWESGHLQLILETLKAVLHEIYVVPKEREERSKGIQALRAKVIGAKAEVQDVKAEVQPPQLPKE